MRHALSVLLAGALCAAATAAGAQTQRQPIFASLQPPPGMETMCKSNGDYFREGARACIRSAYGPQIATCGRVQNVLNWELSGAPCDPPPVRN